MSRKITLCIESLEHGDEILQQPVEQAKETTNKQIDLGNFAVTNNGEVIDEKTPKSEVEQKVEESSKITFHEKRKPG